MSCQNLQADGGGTVRLMFQDEAGFGRISKPSHCWCPSGIRPSVPCHQVREYQYAYGAVDPVAGDSHFLVLPKANTVCMGIFLKSLSEAYPEDTILLVADRATWHTTTKLDIPENIRLAFIPPATPEMNPIEQVWKEIRTRGFKNQIFKTLNHVVDRLCDVICSLSNDVISSICYRDWMAFAVEGKK